MSAALKSLDLEKATVSKDPRGFMRVIWRERQSITLEDAKAVMAETHALAGREPYRVLVDSTRVHQMDKAARDFFAGPEQEATVIACAVMMTSPAGRMMVNFFLSQKKNRTAIRMFGTISEAEAWLVQQH